MEKGYTTSFLDEIEFLKGKIHLQKKLFVVYYLTKNKQHQQMYEYFEEVFKDKTLDFSTKLFLFPRIFWYEQEVEPLIVEKCVGSFIENIDLDTKKIRSIVAVAMIYDMFCSIYEGFNGINFKKIQSIIEEKYEEF